MTARPRRIVLLGHPVAHSLSAVFQNAAIDAAGIDARYEALDVDEFRLPSVLGALVAEDAAGNVTIPHKHRVYELCARTSDVARRAEAVNTWWVEHGLLVGDNTDVAGFDAAASMVVDREKLVVGVLGAGGSAAGVLAAVERWPGCRVLVANRSPGRASELVARFRSVAQESDTATIAASADLVVNATSVGLLDDQLPISPVHLSRARSVIDLVYRPGETAFVRAARARGLAAVGGLPMLLEQGALAFERWFGVAPDRRVMAAAIEPSGRARS